MMFFFISIILSHHTTLVKIEIEMFLNIIFVVLRNLSFKDRIETQKITQLKSNVLSHQTKTIFGMIYLYKLGAQRFQIIWPFSLQVTTCSVTLSHSSFYSYNARKLSRNTSSIILISANYALLT